MSDLESVWEECWTRVTRGEATIEDCLKRYPEYAQDLSLLFAVVVRLSQGRVVRPNAAYKARARTQLLEHMRSSPLATTTGATGARREGQAKRTVPVPARGRSIPFAFRFGLGLAVVAFLLLVSGTMLAQAALPGDALYAWKTGSENVFRAVYPDPLTADLILTDRRAEELTRVAGTPAAERIAQEGYQRVLSDLPRYTDPSSQSKIRKQLSEQKTQLQQAGVNVPAIDRTLKNIGAAPALTPTPSGGVGGKGITPTAAPTPTTTATPNIVLPKPTTQQTATPTHRPTRTPTLTTTPRATSTPSPTRKAKTTSEPTLRVSTTETARPTRTKTLTPTLCATPSPAVLLSPGDDCITSASGCGTVPIDATSCGTPTPTGTPASTIESSTPNPFPTATPDLSDTTSP